MARDGGLGHVRAGVARPDPACLQHMQRGPHSRSSCSTLATLAQISTPSAAHFLKSHQCKSLRRIEIGKKRPRLSSTPCHLSAVSMHCLSVPTTGKSPNAVSIASSITQSALRRRSEWPAAAPLRSPSPARPDDQYGRPNASSRACDCQRSYARRGRVYFTRKA
jgi:hypothetical protein